MLKLIIVFCAFAALTNGQIAYQQPLSLVSPYSQYQPVQYTVSSTPSPYTQTASPAIVRQSQSVVRPYSGAESTATILHQTQDQSPDGTQFQYGFDTDNGISVQQQGAVKQFTRDGDGLLEQVGSYSYTSPEGIPITVNYVANENGFQAQGDHLPTPPPIPEAILRSLQYIAANPPQDSIVESRRRFK